ncbi:glycosyltransferase family 4 protein [Stenotrophomonas sp. PFBMAA-4]|uniref:glycosyltransferase family 4 protein n=1 Tax=Stenotrophomonas sp. PFBMAA-4 TaxID=3043301 RepID=UPI0024B48ACB|nr:glycosyltransferase family 4 protein [Stenotrophomonas sp. PFBMAA-4]MDI9274620.1 glycosyltransferase family 4 protein [Stenotrophomonas sp. PFBMAA-4]
MHVLMLCKRQYTGRDLLDDQYGRLYELPEGLARRGFTVSGLALSYRPRPERAHRSAAGVDWRSINVGPLGLITLPSTIRAIHRRSPVDVVLASSDAPCCILGRKVADRLAVPYVLDLYDNYESFGLSRIPSVTTAFRNACASANGISAVTYTLSDQVRTTVGPSAIVQVIGNAVRTDIFRAMDKQQCRQAMGLPANARLIGCAGAIDESRGISDLFRAFTHLAEHDPSLHLVVAGPGDGTAARFEHPRLLDLGVLDWKRVPLLLNALDVAITCNRDTAFGRCCYPLKLAESLACGILVVAADIGDASILVNRENACLYRPGNVEELVAAVARQLASPRHPARAQVRDWDHRGAALADLLTLASISGRAVY